LPTFLGHGKPVVDFPGISHINLTGPGRHPFPPVVKSQAAFFNHANGMTFMEMRRKGLPLIGGMQQFKVPDVRKSPEPGDFF